MFTDLPLEIIGEIAGKSRLAYHPLVLAYPAFARSLTLGDRLDFAEKFGYDCHVRKWSLTSSFVWTIDGKYHRTDGPTFDHSDGSKSWYIRGNLHRLDGPAIEYDGRKEWHINGKLHRIGGPAVESFDSIAWCVNGKLHRVGGPAVEYTDGYKIWFHNGVKYMHTGDALWRNY